MMQRMMDSQAKQEQLLMEIKAQKCSSCVLQ
jgi:hypothetical protein